MKTSFSYQHFGCTNPYIAFSFSNTENKIEFQSILYILCYTSLKCRSINLALFSTPACSSSKICLLFTSSSGLSTLAGGLCGTGRPWFSQILCKTAVAMMTEQHFSGLNQRVPPEKSGIALKKETFLAN